MVQLIIGDIPLLTRLRDHLFDRRLAHIQRNLGVLVVGLAIVSVFCGHNYILTGASDSD